MSPEILPPHRFPRGIVELSRPPRELFLWGCLPPPPWVAIVGTRHPVAESVSFARELARELGSRGLTVASGGAEGIDAAAHEGALDAGAPTVVVAPAGFGRPYPRQHAELFSRVVSSGGGYLSRVPGHIAARRHVFFLRNQLLVACSELVVLVEAPQRSGGRNAALWARKLGRPLYVVPHAPWQEHGVGCIAELKLGGRALSGYQDVLAGLAARHWPALWNAPAEPTPSTVSGAQSLLPFELAASRGTHHAEPTAQPRSERGLDAQAWRRARLAVQAALEKGALHPDQIQRETGLAISDVHALLSALEFE